MGIWRGDTETKAAYRREILTFIKLWTSKKADWRKGSGQLCFALQGATLNKIRFESMEVRDNLDKGTSEKWRSH